jgi:hypothetical protein
VPGVFYAAAVDPFAQTDALPVGATKWPPSDGDWSDER